jgi:hypothetical protein
MGNFLPYFSKWSSLYSAKTFKIYICIYLIIIFISYFVRRICPDFWLKAISTKRVKGKFCNSLLKDKSNLKEWSGCDSCETGCSCKNCPISFKRYLFRRVLIALYLYAGFYILKLLGMIPILKILGMIGSLFIGTANTWVPIVLVLSCIIPLFRLPRKAQYIFIGSDKVGFKELDNGSTDSPFICGDASSVNSNVVGLGKAKNYFATDCSVNAGYLVLYSLIPIIIVFLILCLIIFIVTKKNQHKEVFESSFADYDNQSDK